MPERDYTVWDDWYGGQAPTESLNAPPTPDDEPEYNWLYDGMATPPFAAPAGQEWFWNGNQWSTRASGGGTTNTGGGMSEQEGRDYDAQHGLYGGYMGDNGWVNGSPRGSGGGSDSYGLGGGSGRYQFAQLAWPEWSPPQFNAPPAFSYADYKPPTLDEAMNEPGYKFAADEGAKRIQNNAAARGNVVSGAAIKDLVKWANDYATQNYNGVYGRGLQTYTTNRNNAADTYMTNYNVSRDVFDRSYNSYSAGDQSRRQKAQLDFQRDWDIYQSDLDTKKFLTTAGNQ